MDADGNSEEPSRLVLVRFKTDLGHPYKVPECSISIPASLSRFGLSTVVDNLITSGTDWESEPFDFLIKNELVRMSLEKFLLAKNIFAGIPTKKQVIKLSPEMPGMNKSDFVWACRGSNTLQKNVFQLMVRNNQSTKLADWLICNSNYDLEPAAFAISPQILPIGPLLASNRLENSARTILSDDSCLNWLDQQSPQSVIFVAFCSIAVFFIENSSENCAGA